MEGVIAKKNAEEIIIAIEISSVARDGEIDYWI